MSKKVALHICCSICLVAPMEDLHSKGYEIYGNYFNPNIQPFEEYFNRYNALKLYIKDKGIASLLSTEYTPELHLNIVRNEAIDRKELCSKCYELRLNFTALNAKRNKISHFSTTLLSSPFQNKDKIREIGAKIEKELKITFIDSTEWEKSHFAGKKRIKDANLYIQKYCGCIYSKMDRKLEKRRTA